MKQQFLSMAKILLLCCLVFFTACETQEENDWGVTDDNTPGTDANPYGSWSRGDGQTAYVKFSGTTAQSCVNGVITTGAFNASTPSMTFVINGDNITFPLKFNNNNTLLVGVPDQAINTNNATLYYRSDKFCNEDGGSNEGKAIFWISSDFSCGPITVTVNGKSSSITSYYYNGAPDCGGSGCANFTLPVGTYSFSASCSGYTWNSGSITVTAGGCSRMQLTK